MDCSHGDDLEGECSRKLDQKLPGVGDPAMLSSDTSYLSSRGRMIKWFWDLAEEGYRTYHMDEYDEDKNPSVSGAPLLLGPKRELQGWVPYLDQYGNIQPALVRNSRTIRCSSLDYDPRPGIINLGTSENKLCFDLLSRRLSQSDMQWVEPSLLQYPDWRGHLFLGLLNTCSGALFLGLIGSSAEQDWIPRLIAKPSLREEVAKFLTFYCKSPVPLRPENVVVLNGGASLFSALATVLCEVGEAFLIPTPYYGAITQHVCLYGNVRLAYVYLDSEVTGLDTRPFQLTVEKLEMALREAYSEVWGSNQTQGWEWVGLSRLFTPLLVAVISSWE
ncbi:hypothetical protein P7K49_021897 [Saguinus oedipus]|uniref:Aminotransferase class I/classII large domain-containing protein n=1 Tax=Saguinus oedipus TaxID=9490 RepID=A0ABQ9UTX7_SAGOE|nr:hypothetical protein P7K49_021897 [Saguinus oedipus]